MDKGVNSGVGPHGRTSRVNEGMPRRSGATRINDVAEKARHRIRSILSGTGLWNRSINAKRNVSPMPEMMCGYNAGQSVSAEHPCQDRANRRTAFILVYGNGFARVCDVDGTVRNEKECQSE